MTQEPQNYEDLLAQVTSNQLADNVIVEMQKHARQVSHELSRELRRADLSNLEIVIQLITLKFNANYDEFVTVLEGMPPEDQNVLRLSEITIGTSPNAYDVYVVYWTQSYYVYVSKSLPGGNYREP